MDYKDYYATLGISTDADEQAIKTAFRRLARVHHPDVAVEKIGATERFKEINEAYTVLSDPDKRRTYDLFRTRYERYQTNYRAPRPEPARPASASATSTKPRTTGATQVPPLPARLRERLQAPHPPKPPARLRDGSRRHICRHGRGSDFRCSAQCTGRRLKRSVRPPPHEHAHRKRRGFRTPLPRLHVGLHGHRVP